MVEVHVNHLSHLELLAFLDQLLGLPFDVLLEEVSRDDLPVLALNALLHALQTSIQLLQVISDLSDALTHLLLLSLAQLADVLQLGAECALNNVHDHRLEFVVFLFHHFSEIITERGNDLVQVS